MICNCKYDERSLVYKVNSLKTEFRRKRTFQKLIKHVKRNFGTLIMIGTQSESKIVENTQKIKPQKVKTVPIDQYGYSHLRY